MAFSFGSSQPTAASTAPLFGTSAASTAAPVFGATSSASTEAPAAKIAVPAVGLSLTSTNPAASAAAPATGGLFGTATAPSTTSTTGGSLFGTTTGGLFGTAPTASAPLTGLGGTTIATQPTATSAPLFGAPAAGTTATSAAAPATSTLFPSSTSAAGGGLFGATATSSAPSTALGTTTMTGGLFGATAKSSATGGLFSDTTATAPATGGLFSGTAPAVAAPAGPVGLGGSTTTNAAGTLNIGGTTNLGAAAAEKENVREGEVPAPIMELLKQAQAKIKDNKDKADEFQKASNDGVKVIKHRLREVDHLISEAISAAASRDSVTATLSAKVTRDCRLGKEAQAVQESMSRSSHNVAQQHAIEHIVHLIREYDAQVTQYQEIIEQMTLKIRDILQGQSQLTIAELKEYLSRFDVIFSSVANKLFEANAKVEDLRSKLGTEEQERIKESRSVQQSWAQLKGPPAFPSQAVLTQIGAMLKPAGVAPAATTGTGLFGGMGSTGTGTSLFGSTTASKPLFGSTTASTGGSLFPTLATNTTNPAPTGSSLFNSLATSTPSKPAFGTTLSANSSSGLLFSSKK